MARDVDRREWQSLALEDPLWAIYSDPTRRRAWDVDAFFATGRDEIEGILAGLEGQGIELATGRALDFGCGVGRLSRALAARFDHVVGVDIAPEMVRRARELNAGVPGCEFVLNERDDLSAFADGEFDLVLSLIALQHAASRPAIRGFLREFVRVTAPGGLLAFQLPSHVGARVRLHPLRVLNRVLRAARFTPDALLRRLHDHSMKLHALPESEVRQLLGSAGATVLAAFPDRRVGTDAVTSLFYVARVRER